MPDDNRRREVAQDLLEWISVARRIVADHFPSEGIEPHNLLIIETARTLMEADRLGRIETMLAGVAAAVVVESPQN